MKPIILMVLVCLAGCGKDTAATNKKTEPQNSPAYPPSSESPTTPATTNAENSGLNKRDVEKTNLLPTDQSNSETDRTITAEIRKSVLAEKGFSINAQNMKIITIDGRVTLRGPVDSPEERERIERLAHGVLGVAAVDNQLEVAEPK